MIYWVSDISSNNMEEDVLSTGSYKILQLLVEW